MNYIEISGFVSQIPVSKELASGARTLNWRLKVPREDSGSDSIPCSINYENVTKTLLTKIENLEVGQTVQISGALRSRFWQSAAGNASRVEVEVKSLKKINKNSLDRAE